MFYFICIQQDPHRDFNIPLDVSATLASLMYP